MPSKTYALQPGEPRRLKVSWGWRWKNFRVELDGREIGRVDGGLPALKAGAAFPLEGGSELKIQSVMGQVGLSTVPQLHLYLDGRPVPGSEAVPIPKWAWGFIAACGAIPVVSMGGAVPAGIGFGAGAACAAVARDETKSVKARVALCAAIAVLAWGGFVGFAVMIASMRK